MKINKIYNEDCLDTMSKMPDGFIDLTVTSPPYDNLRDYNGYSFDFESIAKELFRVTKDGGVVVWVVADQTSKFCESLSSFKQAIYFVEECRFNLLDTMVYHKTTIPPAYPTMRRYAQSFEYMFVFCKNKPKSYNPVQELKIHKHAKKSTFRQKDGSLKEQNKKSTSLYKSKTNLWAYGSGGKDKGHPAVFPEQLANDHIISWSNENDLVYDPFAGSGTTAKMSIVNNRNYIGSEISSEYCEIIETRLSDIE